MYVFMRCINRTHYSLFYRNDDEKEVIMTAYKAILGLVPKLRRLLPIQDDADPAYFYGVVNAVRSAHTSCSAQIYATIQMQVGSNMARSEAIRRIKDNMIKYLAAGQRPLKVDPDWQSSNKALHGLNHPLIGHLIIPAANLSEWDADPDV
jgi:hypothetical protein